MVRVLAGFYQKTHEDERDMGIVAVRCPVGGALRQAYPVRFEDDLEVAGPLCVEATHDAPANAVVGDIA